MKTGKKIAIAVLSAALIVALTVGCFLYNSYTKKFPHSEKSTVAMGTIMTQKLYGDYAGTHIKKTIEIVSSLEDTISVKIASSDVSSLNKGETVKNDTLSSVLSFCKKLSKESDGAFDVTVGKLSALWNIGEEGQKIPEKSEIEKLLRDVSYENISLDGNEVSLKSDCSVDLGAVGKGLACDMIKNYLDKTDLKGAVVAVGGSILAWGDNNKAGDKWQIAVKHPRNENAYLGVISLSEGFVSTSGDYEKYFEEDGVRYHHILNAKTGYPSKSDLVSVTVVCNSGLLSDALSTACFILGKQESLSLLEKYDASAIFVDSEMNVSVVGEIDFEY